MAKQFSSISPELQSFISEQKIFFVGTAMSKGRVNVSPKGMDTLRIINKNKVVWLNLTGSGNETAAQLLETPRMTIMFCAFAGKPLILRLYGQAVAYHQRDEVYQEYIHNFPENAGARQIIVMEVDLVQTSCGYAVPQMDFVEERTILKNWAQKKGKEKIKDYWKEKNTVSLDGHDTKILG